MASVYRSLPSDLRGENLHMAHDEESYTALLEAERAASNTLGLEKSNGIESPNKTNSYRGTGWRRIRPHILVHVVIGLFYTAIFAASQIHMTSRTSSRDAIGGGKGPVFASLLNAAVRQGVRTVPYNFEGKTAFKGPSVAEVQKQWMALLNRPHTLRVSPSQMARANLTSVHLSDGSDDYIVQPVPYHMLHCLYTLYRYLHPEFYGEEPAGPYWVIEHTEHCIDNLREFVMCHASTGVTTFRWLENRKTPWATLNADEVCVDWNHYDEWVQDHSVAMDEITNVETSDKKPMFTHPKLGPVTSDDYKEAQGRVLTAPYQLPPDIAAEQEHQQ